MVEVIYDGNLGNNLFQYCFGRILAQKLGYCLKAKPINGFIGTEDLISGKNFEGGEKIVLRGQKADLDFLNQKEPAYHIVLTGYFQRYEYYREHRNDILQWLRLEDLITVPISSTDLVIGIRRGKDYIPRHGLPLSYYEKAIKAIDHTKLYITTNEPDDPFIRYFIKKYNAVVRPPGAIDNLVFLKKFKKIIISNSSFLWWAAYLSDANEIIYPRPQNGFWAVNEPISKNIDLEIRDPRYTYMDAEKYSSYFAGERIKNLKEIITARSKVYIKRIFPFIKGKGLKPGINFNEDFDF